MNTLLKDTITLIDGRLGGGSEFLAQGGGKKQWKCRFCLKQCLYKN